MVKLLALTFSLTAILAAQSMAITIAPATDLQTMEQARAFYAEGKMQPAIEKYSQITASSDFWLDSLEERAWAYTREGNFESALADLQSITSPVWASQVGPETIMLSTFISLKICSYKDVLKKIAIFKERMLPRVSQLEAMQKNPMPPEFWQMSQSLQDGKISMAGLGKNAENYPRYFYRDQKLISALKGQQPAQAQARLRELAQSDLDEIRMNLKKMKVIEVEMIQKVMTTDGVTINKNSRQSFQKIDHSKQLSFPVNDEEVWVDEVGHYQVKADQCPFNKRSTL